MFSSNSSFSNIQGSYQENFGEQIYYGAQEEEEGLFLPPELETKKHIEVGDYLPYGPRLFYETTDKFVRMKDFGEHSRLLLMGVLGSFTPDCWNRHLFLVLRKLRYYEERNVDYICCVSTNDPFTQKAWGEYLACENEVFMLADPTTRFTKAMGMDIVLPWLDDCVRSRRYLIFAEDMLVTKMILSNCDDANLEWQCEHIIHEDFVEEEEEEEEEEEGSNTSDPWM